MEKFIHKIKKSALSQIVFWGIINVVLILPRLTYGDGVGQTACKEGELCNPLGSSSFAALVKSIANLAMKIGIPIAAIFIIYSGLLFVTARGNQEKLDTAKKSFTWAIIGTAILLGAWTIAEVIETTVKNF